MKKTNITINNFGHYNPLTLKEFIDYISIILKKFSIDLSVTNSFSNKKIRLSKNFYFITNIISFSIFTLQSFW